jgi:hypothetical protein
VHALFAARRLPPKDDKQSQWSGRVGKKSSARGAEWKRRTLPAAVAKKYKIGYFRHFLLFFHNFLTVSMLINQRDIVDYKTAL